MAILPQHADKPPRIQTTATEAKEIAGATEHEAETAEVEKHAVEARAEEEMELEQAEREVTRHAARAGRTSIDDGERAKLA